MNSHLKIISQWTVNNRMQLNFSKSSVMWFRAPGQHVISTPPDIFVNGNRLLNRGIWDLLLIVHFHGLTMSRRYANQCLIVEQAETGF